ncbi:putative OSK4 [Cryptosporidium canis]|uniref:OSK4 n=1 Tax=Cryptosporidium canis TaxID=195482 RepID=A0A9D5DGW5_9CRYT|nr:putative OSK4 [Cryptosporidium canis]
MIMVDNVGKSNRKNGGFSYKIRDYRVGQTLGIGSFGKVKLAIHEPTGRKVAVKIMNKHKMKAINMYEKSIKEISILRSIVHPHIIRLYEVIDTPSDIYIIMEYVTGGELFDYITQKGRISEDESRRLFQQIISGMEYCYINRICHRDLKPENILLDENNNIKIGDFGLSSFISDGDFLNTSCGSPNYAAPEVVSGKAYTGPEIDIWSCGVILYALLCGSLPFDDENVGNLFRKIRLGAFNLPGHISNLAKVLITKMLTVDPSLRITYKEIRYSTWFRHNLPFYLEPQYYHLLLYKLSPGPKPGLEEKENDEEAKDKMMISKILSDNITQEGALWAQRQRRHTRVHSVFSRQLQKKIGVLAQSFSNASVRDCSRRSLAWSSNCGQNTLHHPMGRDPGGDGLGTSKHNSKQDPNRSEGNTMTNSSNNVGGRQSIFKMLYMRIGRSLSEKEARRSDERGFLDKEEIHQGLMSKITDSELRSECMNTLLENTRNQLLKGNKHGEEDIQEKGQDETIEDSLSERLKQVELNDNTEYQSVPTESKLHDEKQNSIQETLDNGGGHVNKSREMSGDGGTVPTSIRISSLPLTPPYSSCLTNPGALHGNIGPNRWLLGFEVSGNLSRIIKIVLFTLKSSDYEWKFISSHKLRCKPMSCCSFYNSDLDNFSNREVCGSHYRQSLTDSTLSTHRAKTPTDSITTIQLFKINPFKYLVDIQIYDGPLITNAFQAFKLTSRIYYNLTNNFYIDIF